MRACQIRWNSFLAVFPLLYGICKDAPWLPPPPFMRVGRRPPGRGQNGKELLVVFAGEGRLAPLFLWTKKETFQPVITTKKIERINFSFCTSFADD